MFHRHLSSSHRTVAWLLASLLLLAPVTAVAGGPKYVAGVSNFNSAVVGQPVHWAQGQLSYYVDQGPLNASVTNAQATAMVDAAAALWSAVSTAGVTLTDKGQLSENVSKANIVVSGTNFTVTNEQTNQQGVIAQPADVTPAATGFPLGVIFDADGSVIDAIFGQYVAEENSCENNGVFVWLDNINPDATFAHGIIVLNGLCATNANKLEMMSFQLERAFGRILGLDYAQVNPGALTNGEVGGTLGWPVMQPYSGLCSWSGGACIPNPTVLRSPQSHLPHHRRQSGQLPRQADHRGEHGFHPGNHQLQNRPGNAGRQRGRPATRLQRQPALPIHGKLRLWLQL